MTNRAPDRAFVRDSSWARSGSPLWPLSLVELGLNLPGPALGLGSISIGDIRECQLKIDSDTITPNRVLLS